MNFMDDTSKATYNYFCQWLKQSNVVYCTILKNTNYSINVFEFVSKKVHTFRYRCHDMYPDVCNVQYLVDLMNHGTLIELAIDYLLDSNEAELLLNALPQSQLTSLTIVLRNAKDFIAHAHVVSKSKLNYLRIERFCANFTIEPDMLMVAEILQQSKLQTFVCRGYNELGVCNRYNQIIVSAINIAFYRVNN